ncbi:hypothetical protein LXL04_015889 [Taraxacum kok-saghyz]
MNAPSLPKSISMLPSPTPLHTTNIKTNQPPISPKLKSPRQPAVKRGGNSHSNDMTSSSDKLLLPLPTKSTTPKSAIPIKKSKKCTTTGDHPGNFYLIHLEREATEDEHREIERFVTDNQVFQLVGNVMIVGKPNRVTYRGPTMLATTLHAMAILLRIDAKWDWFINLSASYYPLVTQDDLISAFSVLPRHLNFIQHSSRLGWKLNKRGKPIMIDPGLYSSNKSDIWWVIKQRALPTAFKLYTEYCIIGYENLPRTLLLYYTNFVSSPEGYFQTVICNSKQYKNTTVNHDLHYITWDTPPKQHLREKNNVDKLREEEMELRESGTFSGNFQELERKTMQRKRVFATLKVLGTVLEQLAKEVSPEEAERLIPQDLKRVIESDAAMTEDLIAYNIIPLDAPAVTNAITSFPEVRAAISSLKYFKGLPKLPANFPIPATRSADMLDFLHYVFGFQKGNVSNQRENIVNLLSNEQSRLDTPDEHEPKLDETVVERVFLKSLDNYIKWCNYLSLPLMWSNSDMSKEKKILFLSLYFLIWGEAANVRFLPECLCYIFHHMGIELVELLSEQLAKPANSCVTENGVSFLEQVICPLYDVIAAEADNNHNGKAPHSAWRNYV